MIRFAGPRKLGRAGVLGINRRNARYIARYNRRRFFPLVDDKLQTKSLAIESGMSVPDLYAVIETQHAIGQLSQTLAEWQDFVIKPARGSGGDGIMVVTGRSGKAYRKHDGGLMVEEELRHHVSSILSGQYSLAGLPDKAMVEYRVRFDPVFENVTYRGVPDVRVIVFRGYPVMAMVRLPTRQSAGKANLHQGAVGAGIDLARGLTLSGVIGNEMISEHPDTGYPIAGIQIPGWPQILDLAARGFELVNLGYLGVDIVLDRDLGPLILELNARPGLNIQIANRAGLKRRLEEIERDCPAPAEAAARVAFSCERFAIAAGAAGAAGAA